MNRFFTIVKVILRNITRFKRNFYIMLAIGLGSAFLILISGAINGIAYQVTNLMRVNYTGDTMIVNKEIKLKPGPTPLQVGWNKMLVDDGFVSRIEGLENVSQVLPRLTLMGVAMGEDEYTNAYATVIGCDFEKEKGLSFKTLLSFQEKTNIPGGVYVGKEIAGKLGVKVGDDIYIFFMTEMGRIPTRFQVAGIFDAKGGYPGVVNYSVYIDYSQMIQGLYLSEDQLSYALVMFKDQKKAPETITRIKKLLPTEARIVHPKESGQFFISQKGMYSVILGIATGLMYISIFLFVYSTLIMSIFSRKREIGITMSMGISNENIFAMYAGEGLLIGFISSLIGSLVGLIIVMILSVVGIPAVNEAMKYGFAADMLYPLPSLSSILLTVLGISVISFIGSIPPTMKILKIKPVEALAEL